MGNFDIVPELFLQASVRTHAHAVTSSDGYMSVLESADSGKKNSSKT